MQDFIFYKWRGSVSETIPFLEGPYKRQWWSRGSTTYSHFAQLAVIWGCRRLENTVGCATGIDPLLREPETLDKWYFLRISISESQGFSQVIR